MIEDLKKSYTERKDSLKKRLDEFKALDQDKYFEEFIFCTLTPQSNAQRCWSAAQEVLKLNQDKWNQERLARILEFKTRFHNNKAKYIIKNLPNWPQIKKDLSRKDILQLRNMIAEKVHGYGLKEAGHFLRNIGKSDNQIAILDRHILRNLKNLGVIETDMIKNDKHYLELEQKFLAFSKQINIPIDELDLLFWSKENGEIFK